MNEELNQFIQTKTCVYVEVVESKGSTPRDAGAWMLVALDSIYETIGGGQLEYLAIEKARAMLASGKENEKLHLALGPEIGQCCGGFTSLDLRFLDASLQAKLSNRIQKQRAENPPVYIFGAGHVGARSGGDHGQPTCSAVRH